MRLRRLLFLSLVFGAAHGADITATAVSIADVEGMTFDRAGNLYLSGVECIFKIDRRGVISRLAGVGVYGESGDGGPALRAEITTEFSDLAIDAAGNIYLTEPSRNRIRRIDAKGIIETIAGTGKEGFSGDGGPAVKAELHGPRGVSFGPNGALYFTDTENHRIRRIAPNGIISTVAGNGADQHSGDGGPALAAGLKNPNALRVDRAGNIWFADGWSRDAFLRRVSPSGILVGVQAPLAGPLHLDFAVDTLYILDSGTSHVHRLSAAGVLTTVPGKLSDQITALAVDDAGRVLIWDRINNRVGRLSDDGRFTAVAGNGFFNFSGDGGPAINAQLGGALDVAVDMSGDVYIADSVNDRIRRVSRDGVITTFAGPDQLIGMIRSIAIDDSGNLFFAAAYATIGKISPAGVITEIVSGGWGYGGDGGPASQAKTYFPTGLALDRSGNLYFADSCNSRVRKISRAGIITTVAGSAKSDTRDGISGAACYATRGFSGDGGPALQANLANPEGVAVDAMGNVFISDTGNNRIRKVSLDGRITTVAGTGDSGGLGDDGPAVRAQLQKPKDLAVDAAGNVYVSDTLNGRVRKILPNGMITTVGHHADNGIALDRSGNLFFIYSTERIAGRVGKVSTDLRLTPIAGTESRAPAELLRVVVVGIPKVRRLNSRMPLVRIRFGGLCCRAKL